MEKFNTLISSDTPVLVDFYADWCGPCKAMGPAIQEVGKEVEGKARVIKVNIDKNQAAAMQYNVRAVPTFIIFKNGRQVWRHSGMIDKNSLEKQLLAFAS
jgi:thioredoxin 1